ncbi:SRPBCC family protein [Nocardia jiangxiensis]|uniref:SRPBCC family protein n=1 Tax=Nocardia jiangxiensis TaxID=282685 RepID=A0ABW6S463_9NOCA
MLEQFRVQRAVAAPAAEIFAILSDPQGHVAIDSSGMLMAASGEVVTGTGDTFVVHMDREALNDYPLGLYDVTVEIVRFEPDREIAWTVHGRRRSEHIYGYELEPIEAGTLVTSYYDWSAVPQELKDQAGFPIIPESALRATLGILARTVAPGKPRPELPAR